MKSELAESILRKVMEHWDTNRLSEELRDIQIISQIKYDDYQQYTHGMRYVESLALWLRQFETPEERELAYCFVKNRLLYISAEEMLQLVEFAYPMIMKPYLLNKTSKMCKENAITSKEDKIKLYHYLRRTSLFLGLSDGAHIDFFRRQNPSLSNEQVFLHYDFSKDKADDMLKKLKEDMEALDSKADYCSNASFNTFFLIDDFSASGRSYIRLTEEGWDGKICKFFKRLNEVKYQTENVDVYLLLYVSTEQALQHIREQVAICFLDKNVNVYVEAIQKTEPIDMEKEVELEALFAADFNRKIAEGKKSFVDKHYEVGGGKNPYWGFSDCSLPLIIYHNTPNNSFPILWYSWENSVNALFPRTSRHKEN